MFRRLGLTGLLGVVVMCAGIGLIVWENWRIGLGITLVLFGMGTVVKGAISQFAAQFGFGM